MSESQLEIIPVLINGKSYRTALYGKVQRFVPNEAVDFLVNKAISDGSLALNELPVKVLRGEVPLEDYIEFHTLCKGSLGHFVDSLSSLIDLNPSFFTGTFEEIVVIENPLWEDES